MRLRLPERWNVLSHGEPGHRFQERYHAHRRNRTAQSLLHRVQRIILAGIAMAIGVVLVFIPGPAIVFFFLAGTLLALDWLWMARTLDWLEVKLRAWWESGRRAWRRLPTAGRVALLVVGASAAAATTYGAYRLMS